MDSNSISNLDLDSIQFVYIPSNSLLCPVCRDLCQEPVITHRCHHSYCAKCIYQSISIEPFCPLCRCRLRSEDLHPNLALSSLINELLVYCKYKSNGCTEKIRLDSYASHLEKCPFAPNCCTHKEIGCNFKGTVKEVEEHLINCLFEKISPFIIQVNERMALMENRIREQNKEITELKYLLKGGETKIDNNILNKVSPYIESVSKANSSIDVPIETFPNGDIRQLSSINQHTAGVTSLVYSNGLLFSGSHDGKTKIFDTSTEALVWDQATHSTSVWGLAVFQDEKRFFTASSDKLIKVWDWTIDFDEPSSTNNVQHYPIKVLDEHKGKVYSLLCRFGKLFSGSSDKTVKVWDPRSLDLQSTLIGHNDNVNSLVALRNNKLATGSSDRTIKIWDISTSQCIDTIEAQGSEVLDVAVSDDQEMLFASTYDASILVYSLNSRSLITTLTGHNWEVWQVAYQSGKLFSGSFDHTIKRWDPRMNACDLTLHGHNGFVHALAMGPDRLFSGCADRTVKVWK